MGVLVFAASVLVISLLLKIAIGFFKALRAIRGHSGYITLTHSNGALGILFQRPIPGVLTGSFWPWLQKYKPFEQFGVDVISAVSALPTFQTVFWIADASAAKQVVTNRFLFPKPVAYYKFLDIFGGNIVSAEGDQWKQYRRVCGPSFTEPNNKLVWEETAAIMKDLFENVWKHKIEVVVDHVSELTLLVALHAIGRAAFGINVFWNDSKDRYLTSEHSMSLQQSLRIVSKSLLPRALLPTFLYQLAPSRRIRFMRAAFDQFQKHFTDMIQARQESSETNNHDLFSNLLKANREEADERLRLKQSEVIGNAFLFLLAGHETTAHTMAFVLGLLAVYQEEQELLYRELSDALHDDGDLTFHDMNKLARCSAFVNEALRMYPPVMVIPKCATKDTTLTTTTSSGETVVITVPRDSIVAVNVPALHYNPRYWEEPNEFKPSRFLGDWDRDAFFPFGVGSRSCIGRRFAETELVAVIAFTLLRYKVDLLEEQQLVGESLTERRERVLKCKYGNTLTPVDVPMVLRQRGGNAG